MASPRLPPAAAPPAPQEPAPEVADAWIQGRPAAPSQVSARHPADTRQVSGEHPADTSGARLGPVRDQAFWERTLGGDAGSPGHLAGVSQVSARHPKPRAPAGSAVLFERKRGRPKRRMNVYFRTETFDALREYCAREEEDLSGVIDRAVAELLARER